MSEDVDGVVVSCGSCGSRLRIRADAAGRMGKCPKCGVRVQIALPVSGETVAKTQASGARDRVTIDAPPGKFVFFPGEGRSPEIRSVPSVSKNVVKVLLRRDSQGFSVAMIAVAALVAGAIACHAVERLGGTSFWVVKRSVVAWMIGMMSAGTLIVASRHRTASERLIAAAVSVGAIIGAKLLAWPVVVWGPVDTLLVALAVGGSACAFILAENQVKANA